MIWFVLLVILNGIIHVSINHQSATELGELTDLDPHHELYSVIEQAHRLSLNKQHLAALSLLEQNETTFTHLPRSQRQILYEFYQLKGHCHAALWQYIEAEGMWHQASEYAVRADDKKRMRDLVQMSRRAINDMNQERNNKEVYHASPHVGPAAMLRGKVALI